jgi:hypothetical protein
LTRFEVKVELGVFDDAFAVDVLLDELEGIY